MAVKDARLGNNLGALERRRKHGQFFADLADLLIDAAGTFEMMRQNGTVKFLRAETRLAPAKN